MKKNLKLMAVITFMLLLIPVSSFAGGFGGDNALHFGTSAVFGGISESYMHYKTSLTPSGRIVAGTILGSTPGLIKEIIDVSESDNHFSETDMIANVTGAFLGSLIADYINNKIQVNVAKEAEKTKFFLSYKF